jgi:hypothetical protein
MREKLTAGSEVDAYCTKCRLDLGHRIVAMVGDTIRRVECLTCHGQHAYRAPHSAPRASSATASVHRRGDAVPAPRASSSAATPMKAPAKARVASSAAAARLAERSRWEHAVLGKEPELFAPYAMTTTFAEGQLVEHVRFGRGVVIDAREAGKVEILFADAARKLAHGRPAG